MKTHLNLATTDMTKSVMFYSTLLNVQPMKLLDDYGLFITDQPGLEVALDLSEKVTPARDHFGIFVESADEVERGETCCYANQTKVWAIDREGPRWEFYTVHEDAQERDSEDAASCATDGKQRACCLA